MRSRHAPPRPVWNAFTAIATIVTGAAAGAAVAVGFGWYHPGPWAIDFAIPRGGQARVPSMEVIAGFVAGGVAAVFIIGWAITWAARQRHRAQKQWADHGGTVIHGHGQLAARVDLSIETVTRNRDRLTQAEEDIAELKATNERLRNAIGVVGEGLLTACANSGLPEPEMPLLDEPPTAPVFQLFRGGKAG